MASPDPPPAAGVDGGSRPPTDAIEALAARLAIDLPPECIDGVRHHVALLDRHWDRLRAFMPET